jgi:hypothetical protein
VVVPARRKIGSENSSILKGGSMKVIYPTHKYNGNPTPADRLVFCLKCGQGEWKMYTNREVPYHESCRSRCRDATPKEREEALALLDVEHVVAGYVWAKR